MQTLQDILNTCSAQVPFCYLQKALELDKKLSEGTPYTELGGKRIRHNPNLIRFKIGRRFRLLYFRAMGVMVPYCLITRQQLQKILMRR
ncbi:hypothetical protein [Sedimenticola thiotaurini]|uniref:ParE family toxin-like protein n=1 Tax=Sedimenticola thiotaurini TaxID=1543721 RepID=UPI000699DD19|nr:hypothetical protein [Sedimenticola thiotaurini]